MNSPQAFESRIRSYEEKDNVVPKAFETIAFTAALYTLEDWLAQNPS